MTTTQQPTTAAPHTTSPDLIFQVAQGFMASKHLFAASELGIFEALGEGEADLAGLAARTGLTRRTARISADAMVAIGLLERRGDRYANTPVAAAFMSGATQTDLRPLLRFWDKLSYPAWSDLAGALGRGRPTRQIVDIDPQLVPVMSAGIEAATSAAAHALPHTAKLPPMSRVLDIGGGTGSWSVTLAAADPTLTATVLELPDVAAVAREQLHTTAYAGRIDVHSGDVLTDDLPCGFNVFLLANLVHYFTPETNRTILHRVRAAAPSDARLLLADFWTDPTHTQPVAAALMAGEFAIHIKAGDVYSVEEAAAWLEDTGWRYLDHRPLAGPLSLIVAETP